MLEIKTLFFIFSMLCLPIAYGISIHEAQEMEYNSNVHAQSTDQGSISKERWENFLKINNSYQSYKKNMENIANDFEKHVDLLYFKELRDLISTYRTSLIVLERYDTNYFNEIFPNKSSDDIYNETIKEIEILLLQIINKSFYQYLNYYFINNSKFIKKIEFNFWFKAYWPLLNSQSIAGFEPPHYLKNSVKTILDYDIFNNFLIKSRIDDADFMQKEIVFGEYWNSGSVKPWATTYESNVYYKFKFNKNTEILKIYLLNDINFYKKDVEMLFYKTAKNNLILNVLNFKTKIFEILLNLDINIKNKKFKNETIEKKTKFNISNYLLNSYKIFYKNRCVSKLNNRNATYVNCVILEKNQEWVIFPVSKNFKEFKIYSVAETGKCLENKLGNRLLISKCINNNKNQIWFYSQDNNKNKVIKNLESKMILGSTIYNKYKVTRESLLFSSFFSDYKLYSENDWKDGVLISKDIPYILYLYQYFNEHKIPNNLIEFLKIVNDKHWSKSLTPTTQNIINKIIENPKMQIENSVLLNLFEEIVNKKILIRKIGDYTIPGDFYFVNDNNNNEKNIFISKFYGNLTLDNIVIPNGKYSNKNFIYFASCPSSFNNDLVINYIKFLYALKYQDLFSKIIFINKEKKSSIFQKSIFNESKFLNESFLILSKMNGHDENYDKIDFILKYPNIYSTNFLIDQPIYENLPYQRIENSMYRFFELVDESDGYLLNQNEFRVPTYREVWDRWSRQEWNPHEEFEQIYRHVHAEIEGSSQDLFDRLFDDFQNYWIEELLNRYERQEQGIQVSGNSSEISSGYDDVYPVSMRSQDSGLSSDFSQELMPMEEVGNDAELLENMEVLEEANNIEMLFEGANVSAVNLEASIQALNDLTMAENFVTTTTISTVLPILIFP